ncbi:MAG: lysine--tRNA ligase [Oscillospiraceae bacterium]|nr:lysine--tRNA ligase [Oscillospiraceae bacterium]
MDNNTNPQPIPERLMHRFPSYRIDKLKNLREGGVHCYPERFAVSHTLAEAALLPDGAENVRVAGRIAAIRKLGKLTFCHLQDVHGRMQFTLKQDILGAENYALFHRGVDIGDFLGVEGTAFTTKTGEKTVQAASYTFLGKALRELPEKWHGLSDQEARWRQRYLDLISNAESRKAALLRPRLLSVIRRFLESRDFVEVETPILTNKPSGALATPFFTHHQALDIDVYLRIAPEMYLKRLVTGGFTHVFEVARCFRNEGISPVHIQDFTMIEGYSAYFNYEDNMKLLREMILEVLRELFGGTVVSVGGNEIDFESEWRTVSFRDLILEDAGIDIAACPDNTSLLREITSKSIYLEHEDLPSLGKGNLIDLLYKKVSRPKIIAPLFLVGHPTDLSPLARRSDSDPNTTDRFQLLINGAEVINAYSELVDPIDQRLRLEEQAALRLQGDTEAMPLDEDYLLCMEYGMPPISGWGMGIDRLLQVLLGLDNIREGVLFPLMRPLDGE